ncbi:hypothetical protein BD770DRAFT_389989 [Pilaira anomala]|nr:hypothetical protein BD770DRAFT_389989 [Pilaira anomala]
MYTKVHVWSNLKSARGYTNRKNSHIFMVEPKDPKIYPLKFKCVTIQDKDKWLAAIKEQLALTTKIWSYSAQPDTTTDTSNIYDRQILPVSVLDKWLDQLQVIDTSSMIQREAAITLQRNSVSLGSSLSSITAITTNRRNSLSSTITINNRRDSGSTKKPTSVKMKKITTFVL